MKNLQTFLPRLITSALFIAVVAGTWDAWWHSFMGRDSFWEPPHLFLYSAVIVAILAGIYGWRQTKEKIWARLALVLLLIPISAPFDDLWHRAFGVEDLASPLVIWSPPHLVLIGAIIFSFIMVLPHLKREKDIVAQRFFTALAIAGIFSLAMLLTMPFNPIGPYALLGYGGVVFISFVAALLILIAQKRIPGLGSATLMIMPFLILQSLTFSEGVATNVIIQPHGHPPGWLQVFSFLVPVALIDIFPRLSSWIKGGIVGLLTTGILYTVFPYFFIEEYSHTSTEALTAIVAGTIGGLLAGFLLQRLRKKV